MILVQTRFMVENIESNNIHLIKLFYLSYGNNNNIIVAIMCNLPIER